MRLWHEGLSPKAQPNGRFPSLSGRLFAGVKADSQRPSAVFARLLDYQKAGFFSNLTREKGRALCTSSCLAHLAPERAPRRSD